MPRLTDIAKEVGNAISTRERVVPLFRRLKELESYMDPSFGESKGNVNSSYSRLCTIIFTWFQALLIWQQNIYIFLGLPAELKVEMILAQEEKIRKSAELLKDIQVTSCSELKWCPKLEIC